MTTVSEDLGITTAETTQPVAPEAEVPSEPVSDTETSDGNGDATTDDIQVIEAPAIDMAEQGENLVAVKIDGVEQYVPLSEAVSGYQRQADYTRKTQEVAAERAANNDAIQIGKAYQTNPQFTAEFLAKQAGLTIGSPQVESTEDVYQTPEEQALADANARIEQLESKFTATQAQVQLDQSYANLESRVGEVDRTAVQDHMQRTGVFDPEMAWAHMNMDNALNGRVSAANDSAKKAVLASKKEAQIVHKPSTSASKATTATVTDTIRPLRESALMAENGVEVPAKFSMPDWITPA